MIRVKMLTLDAGPKGVRRAGTIQNLEDAEARDLIQARSAVECDAKGEPLERSERRVKNTIKAKEDATNDAGGKRRGEEGKGKGGHKRDEEKPATGDEGKGADAPVVVVEEPKK